MEAEGAASAATTQECSTSQNPLKKCSISDAAWRNDCFDCNICLDFVADPVVTLCGHLYCWPCIYRWLQQSPGDSPQQCPVCKAALLQQTLVPLYGRGQGTTVCQQHNFDIPRRPSFEWEAIQRQLTQSSGEAQNPGVRPPRQHQVLDYPRIINSLPSPTLGGAWLTQSTSGELLRGLTVAMLRSMFRDQSWARLYNSSPDYLVENGGSQRVRRLEAEMVKSLHQIWVFLFCCVIMCLFFF